MVLPHKCSWSNGHGASHHPLVSTHRLPGRPDRRIEAKMATVSARIIHAYQQAADNVDPSAQCSHPGPHIMEDVTARNTSVVACAEATLYTTQAQTVADGPLRMTTTASPAPPTEACFRIPSEIWDIIIDFHHDDHQTLVSCSLVCRDWCPTARMHRFHEIKIKPRPGGPPPAASLLCDPTSTVLPYVRRLDILEGLPASREGGEDHNEKPLASGDSMTTFWLDDILPVMRIHELTALESVSLGRLRWDILSHRSRDGIMELCRRIRSLKLSCWVLGDTPCSAVLQMLSAATTLQRFELLNHWIHPALLREDELPIPPVPGPALVLHSLCISDVANLYLPALQRYFMTIRVSEVVLSSVVTVDMEVVASFLNSCAPSLERVTLRIALPSLRRGRVKGTFAASLVMICISVIWCDPQFQRPGRHSSDVAFPVQHRSRASPSMCLCSTYHVSCNKSCHLISWTCQ